MCLGNKKEKKEWYSKFDFKPYPKLEAHKKKEDLPTLNKKSLKGKTFINDTEQTKLF
jgi:hypothetical protein